MRGKRVFVFTVGDEGVVVKVGLVQKEESTVLRKRLGKESN